MSKHHIQGQLLIIEILTEKKQANWNTIEWLNHCQSLGIQSYCAVPVWAHLADLSQLVLRRSDHNAGFQQNRRQTVGHQWRHLEFKLYRCSGVQPPSCRIRTASTRSRHALKRVAVRITLDVLVDPADSSVNCSLAHSLIWLHYQRFHTPSSRVLFCSWTYLSHHFKTLLPHITFSTNSHSPSSQEKGKPSNRKIIIKQQKTSKTWWVKTNLHVLGHFDLWLFLFSSMC